MPLSTPGEGASIMHLSSIVFAVAQSADEGLLDGILESAPTDPASIFALLLIVGVAGAVIWFGRPRGGGGNQP